MERERQGRETTHLDGKITRFGDQVIDVRTGVLHAVPSSLALSPSLNAGLQQVYRKCATFCFYSSLLLSLKKLLYLRVFPGC